MAVRARGSWRVLAAAVFAAVALGACTSDAERRQQHVERAAAYSEAGQFREALIELRSALKLDPQSPEINFLLGEILERNGHLQDALFFFGEARRLDPNYSDAALREAALLVFDDLDRMEELIEEVLAREPGNDHAYVVRSRLELARNDPDAALKSALTAVELAPEKTWTHQQLGKVHQARIQLAQLGGDHAPEDVLRAALQSFQRAAELSPSGFRWLDELEMAKVLAAWPGREEEAAAAYKGAVASAEKDGGPTAFAEALQATANYSERRGDDELGRWTLERHVEVVPSALESWTRLALIEERDSGNGIAVMDRMLEALGDSVEGHVRYAQFLVTANRQEEALAHLEQAVERGVDRAEAMAAHSNFLIGLGRREQAAAVVRDLERDHPTHPRTALAQAQLALAERRIPEAAEILRASVARGGESAATQRMLANTELRLGNLQAARAAISRSLELSATDPEFPEAAHRLRVRISRQLGDCQSTILSLGALRRAEHSLSTIERVDMAHCLYETGRGELGRRMLVDLLNLPNPPSSAVLEFARREGRRQPQKLREILERAASARPDDASLVVQLARLDLRDGKPEQALERINTVIAKGQRVSPELVLERARVLAVQGEIELAQRDALQAFQARPDLDAAAGLLLQLYRAQGQIDEVVASFEQARDAGARGAPARVLLARLYLSRGEREKAREALEAALAERSDLPGAKNDLAFLLARDGGNLDRALRLAQEAVQALSDRPEPADTLGFVYYKKGLMEPALQQFRYAIELAEREENLRAVYPYHLGLALAGLGLDAAAAEAFERALAIDADFEDAALELRRLKESAELPEPGASTS